MFWLISETCSYPFVSLRTHSLMYLKFWGLNFLILMLSFWISDFVSGKRYMYKPCENVSDAVDVFFKKNFENCCIIQQTEHVHLRPHEFAISPQFAWNCSKMSLFASKNISNFYWLNRKSRDFQSYQICSASSKRLKNSVQNMTHLSFGNYICSE